METYDKFKDIDLKFGQMGEQWMMGLGGETTAEVKTERLHWFNTENLAIEYESRGKPSGIAITTAAYWIHLVHLDGEMRGGFIFPVAPLRDYLRAGVRSKCLSIMVGGDDKTSKFVLLPMRLAHQISFH